MNRNLNILYLMMVFFFFVLPSQHLFAEQKILFCAESMKYSKVPEYICERGCKKYSPDRCLQKELDAGWKITAVSPKEIPEISDSSSLEWECTCIGQQYILSKDERQETEKVECELIKKENELLKREVLILKAEINTQKKKP